MDLKSIFKQAESSKISEEIMNQSTYQKDINNYYSLGFANGTVNTMKVMSKEDREIFIKGLKELYDKDTEKNKTLEYIFRLYNDEFKLIEI